MRTHQGAQSAHEGAMIFSFFQNPIIHAVLDRCSDKIPDSKVYFLYFRLIFVGFVICVKKLQKVTYVYIVDLFFLK